METTYVSGEVGQAIVACIEGGVMMHAKAFWSLRHARDYMRTLLTEDWARECEESGHSIEECVEKGIFTYGDFDMVIH
jgi:hypothetical protein